MPDQLRFLRTGPFDSVACLALGDVNFGELKYVPTRRRSSGPGLYGHTAPHAIGMLGLEPGRLGARACSEDVDRQVKQPEFAALMPSGVSAIVAAIGTTRTGAGSPNSCTFRLTCLSGAARFLATQPK